MLNKFILWAIYAPIWQVYLAEIIALVILIRLALSLKGKKVVWQIHPKKKVIWSNMPATSLNLSGLIGKMRTTAGQSLSKFSSLSKYLQTKVTPGPRQH